jgi:Immunity protein 22
MSRVLDGHYRADGMVSVWLGTFPDEASHQRYFKEDWEDQDHDGFPSCPFWSDLGIRWFDHDFQEGGFVGHPVPVAELLSRNWSYLDTFRELLLTSCAQAGIGTTNSVMFLFDFDYPNEAGYSSPHMTFVGVFPYSKGDD